MKNNNKETPWIDQGSFRKEQTYDRFEINQGSFEKHQTGKAEKTGDSQIWICPNDETTNTGDICVICGCRRPERSEEKKEVQKQAPPVFPSQQSAKGPSVSPYKDGKLLLLIAAVIIIASLFVIRACNAKSPETLERPTTAPTTKPTAAPTASPTTAPTTSPTTVPTTAPTVPHTTAPAVKESFLMRAGETLVGKESDQWEKQYFWGQKKYKRGDVTRVVFYDSLQGVGSSGWDISQNGDGTVRAWMDGSKLCIAANGKVALNQNASCLFAGFVNLQQINFNNAVDTSRVENMCRLFSACNSLTSLDLSSFDTSRVTDMSHMFAACEALTSLDLSSFDTSQVEDMESMFYGCKKLTSLNINSFNTSSVRNMVKMFAYCGKMTTINVSRFDTHCVTDMSSMFRNCTNLQSVDVSGFNTSNVTKINSMFYKCTSLSSVDLRGFDTSRMYGLCYVLQGCPLISNIEARNWVIASNAQYTDFMDKGDTINGIPWEKFFKG